MGRDVIEITLACADTQLTWVMIDADAAYPYAGVRRLVGAEAVGADAWTSGSADQPEFADAWADCYGTAVLPEFVDAWMTFAAADERGDAR